MKRKARKIGNFRVFYGILKGTMGPFHISLSYFNAAPPKFIFETRASKKSCCFAFSFIFFTVVQPHHDQFLALDCALTDLSVLADVADDDVCTTRIALNNKFYSSLEVVTYCALTPATMDFGRPLETQASIASQSQIRLLEPVTIATAVGNTVEERTHNVPLDNEVVQAANETAAAVFLGSTSTGTTSISNAAAAPASSGVPQDDSWLLDASHYTDRVTATHPTIQAGDLVVIQESFDRLDFVYCQPGAIYNNRNGAFHHRDFLGQPFGTKLRSRDWRGYGFIYLLKPTPELWTRSLNHRTQVVHELDQSQIVFQLHLQPNCTVVESGTGSGALSHALLRTVAPAGHLHTYEFSAHRVSAARREFQQHGLGHLVTVHHRDVCGHGSVVEEENENDKESTATTACNEKKSNGIARTSSSSAAAGGFDLPPASVDAVVLDLPEPWVAVPHAAAVLRSNARIATYSPCVEQTQRTCEALEANGFHSIQTFEYRLKEYYVDAQVEWEAPPAEKRPRHAAHNVLNYTTAAGETATGDGGKEEEEEGESGGDDTGVDHTEDGGGGGGDEPIADDPTETTSTTTPPAAAAVSKKRKRHLVARPFAQMRGHTAFLTFATKNPMDIGISTATAASTASNTSKTS